MLNIDDGKIQKICEHAIKEYPNECCGILLGNREKESVWEMCRAGKAEGPDRRETHFRIDPLELYQIEIKAGKENMEIIGFYHSHANHPAMPSEEDLSLMLPGLFYLIISAVRGVCTEVKCYRKTSFQGEICETKIDSDYLQGGKS